MKGGKFYAVARGFIPGIYTCWPDAKKQVYRFHGCKFKSFPSYKDAVQFMQRYAQSYVILQVRGPMDKFLQSVDGEPDITP